METRFIENDPYNAHYWECEQCKSAWCWEHHPSEGEVNYCPACGRKISEFVDYVDPLDDENTFECKTYCSKCEHGRAGFSDGYKTEWHCALGKR